MNLAELRHSILQAFIIEGNKHGWEVVMEEPHQGGFMIAYLTLKRECFFFHDCIYARDIRTYEIIKNGVYSYEHLVKLVSSRYKLLNDCFRIRKERYSDPA